MANAITICEMSPRDGMQSLNRDARLPIDMRVKLIEALQLAKLPYIEAASFVSSKVFPQFADSAEVFRRLKPYDGELAALVPNFKYYDQYKDAPNLTTVAVFLSASDEYSRKNKRVTIDEDLVDAKRIASLARSMGHRVRAHLSGAFRDLTEANRDTDPVLVARVCDELIDAGCQTVALADTDGRATPADVQRTIGHLFDRKTDRATIGVHLHDRDGQAIENGREALRLGVRTFDTAVGGIGGNRASTTYVGNLATESLIALLDEMRFESRIDREALRSAHDLIAEMAQLVGDPAPARF